MNSGDFGERLAREYMEGLGYKILAQNYTKTIGEIDIIATKDDIIIFTEVKTRKNIDFGSPRDFVNPNKIRRILKTAEIYMLENDLFDYQPRFDVCEVILEEDQINYLENAFP